MAAADVKEELTFNIKLGNSYFVISSANETALKNVLFENGASLKVIHGQENINGKSFIYSIDGFETNLTDSVLIRNVKCYSMCRNKLGILHVFNNLNNDKEYANQNASNNDVTTIKKTFEAIGFDVKVNVPKSFKMMKLDIKNVLKADYSEYNIFAIFFLTHGRQGEMFGPEEKTFKSFLNLNLISNYKLKVLLAHNISLTKIPKLIFCESCRGKNEDCRQMSSVAVKAKNSKEKRFSNAMSLADMFWACSTTEGYVSVSVGSEYEEYYSPWVKELCERFVQNFLTTDLEQIYLEFKNYMSKNPVVNQHELVYFQMPDIQVNTLTKRLYLNMLQNKAQIGKNVTKNKSNQTENEVYEQNYSDEYEIIENSNVNNPEFTSSKFKLQPKQHSNPNDKQCKKEQNSTNLLVTKTNGEYTVKSDLQNIENTIKKAITNGSNMLPVLYHLYPEFDCYPMSKKIRGDALVLNNEIFEDKYINRYGSRIDQQNLKDLLHYLGFNVKCFNNLPAKDIKQTMQEFALKCDLKDEMCIVAILSHGNKNFILGTDGEGVKSEDILSYFNNENCPNLIGKPKLFLFNCCRGDKYDMGVATKGPKRLTIYESKTSEKQLTIHTRIPTWEDMLIVKSTLPNYVSYRNTKTGSWFIATFCKVFKTHACDLEIIDLLNLVMLEMGKLEIGCGVGMSGKQCFVYENRHFYKKLYFNPGLYNDEKENLEITETNKN